MTLEEDLKRAEEAVKAWQTAVRFHRNSPEDKLNLAVSALHRAEEYRESILRLLQEQSAHKELTFMPWIDEL